MKETVYFPTPKAVGKAALYVLDQDGRVHPYELGDFTRIGRKTSSSTADIQISAGIVSRNHGEIVRMPDGYIYRDAGSLNGTYINGVLYGRNSRMAAARLQSGDVIRIGLLDQRDQRPVLLLFAMGELQNNWHTEMLTDRTEDIMIGRDISKKDGVRLQDEAISRKHASFCNYANGWCVVDHNSTNGVYVNNTRITGAMELNMMDVVRIANTTFIFLGDRLLFNAEETGNNQLCISIRERSVGGLGRKKVLLQNINLVLEPGDMMLILGGSGAGKSTFMNAVMGYEKAKGEIRLGDTDIYKHFAKMKYQIGYVPQQDLMREDDLVLATLDNAARMKMPSNTTDAERAARIDQVLDLLGLSREKHSLVKKLSGGQKKRLSIAIEFISDPSLFFLDEPDSGLDGIMATSLMENLRVIANEGKIIMVITHGPDRVRHLFDKVLVLAKSAVTNSGHMAFFGPINEALRFFDTDSLEGVVRRINRPDEGGDGMSDYYIEKFAAYEKENR